MLATMVLLRLSGKLWPWPFVWLLSCAAVTLADPWALLQPGFWLSFVAVGVLFASSAGDPAAPGGWRQPTWGRWCRSSFPAGWRNRPSGRAR